MASLPFILKRNGEIEMYQHYVAAAVGSLAGMQKSYADLINYKKADTRTAEEILADTISGAGLVVIEN